MLASTAIPHSSPFAKGLTVENDPYASGRRIVYGIWYTCGFQDPVVHEKAFIGPYDISLQISHPQALPAAFGAYSMEVALAHCVYSLAHGCMSFSHLRNYSSYSADMLNSEHERTWSTMHKEFHPISSNLMNDKSADPLCWLGGKGSSAVEELLPPQFARERRVYLASATEEDAVLRLPKVAQPATDGLPELVGRDILWKDGKPRPNVELSWCSDAFYEKVVRVVHNILQISGLPNMVTTITSQKAEKDWMGNTVVDKWQCPGASTNRLWVGRVEKIVEILFGHISALEKNSCTEFTVEMAEELLSASGWLFKAHEPVATVPAPMALEKEIGGLWTLCHTNAEIIRSRVNHLVEERRAGMLVECVQDYQISASDFSVVKQVHMNQNGNEAKVIGDGLQLATLKWMRERVKTRVESRRVREEQWQDSDNGSTEEGQGEKRGWRVTDEVMKRIMVWGNTKAGTKCTLDWVAMDQVAGNDDKQILALLDQITEGTMSERQSNS